MQKDDFIVGVPLVPLSDEILIDNGIMPGQDNTFKGGGSANETWTVNIARKDTQSLYSLNLKWEIEGELVGLLKNYDIMNTRTLQDVFRMMYVPVQIEV